MTTSMRVHIHGDPLAAQFSNKLLDIGNGKLPQDPEDNLHHLPCGNMTASLEELKSKVFPNIATNYKSQRWLCERTIRAPRNVSVDKLNLNLLTQLPGPECSYRSINSVPDQQQATHYPVEFLNSLQPPTFPPHILIVKIGAPIMLLRNLDAPRLCNGTRSSKEDKMLTQEFKGCVVIVTIEYSNLEIANFLNVAGFFVHKVQIELKLVATGGNVSVASKK
ncbi:uncharacterized protein LOC106874392 [Octopus bimaculoides]|uniref:uncharacterized protein LOC106874392 n=1 Tax=Octopus bimaculoides TaxID=37653 RepID=UPI00071DF69E|nr:uncharacterized protein LOC106874392 [Octopus bimaculoides]|eukprot:XP_014777595.1 PREDICTED: uncharacterized protein LOC106874392 [Octopus bimaculoides]